MIYMELPPYLREAMGAPTGRPFLYVVMRDMALERGDAASLKKIEKLSELWHRTPEEWELLRVKPRVGDTYAVTFEITYERLQRMAAEGQSAIEALISMHIERARRRLVEAGVVHFQMFSESMEPRTMSNRWVLYGRVENPTDVFY